MKKIDNHGFTLVELMISMAMMALVAVGALQIYASASRSYEYSNNELNLQTEAQIMINQLQERAVTANNVSYEAVSGTAVTVSGNTYSDYLLTLYDIRYLSKTQSAVTGQDIFWIHKGTGKNSDTIFLFSQTLEQMNPVAAANLVTAEQSLVTTDSAIKTNNLIAPAVTEANRIMDAAYKDVVSMIRGGTVTVTNGYEYADNGGISGATTFAGAFSNEAEREDIYKRHMLCRNVDSFTCNGVEKIRGGFDRETNLSVQLKLKRTSRTYEVSDVAHLRSKLRAIPKVP